MSAAFGLVKGKQSVAWLYLYLHLAVFSDRYKAEKARHIEGRQIFWLEELYLFFFEFSIFVYFFTRLVSLT